MKLLHYRVDRMIVVLDDIVTVHTLTNVLTKETLKIVLAAKQAEVPVSLSTPPAPLAA